ncbi:MAG: hypothetical protein FJW36_16385 [Acidobacteria bacterium]|nr:hypothetical protein [Acidobacteriota bacterium]
MKYKSLFLAATMACSLLAQTTQTSAQKKNNSGGGDLFEINLFGGGAFFHRQQQNPHQDQSNGGVAGFRVTQNFWNYISLEQTGMVNGIANTIYRIPATDSNYAIGTRLRQFHFNPVFHFKPRESRVRPFFTTGFGMDYFGITDTARRQVGNGVNTPFGQLTNLESQFRLAFNYGMGVKAKLTDRIGIRFDTRAFMTDQPDLGVKGAGLPNMILATKTTPLHSLQTTGGINFYLGPIDQGPIGEFRVNSIEPSTATIWRGESASFNLGVNNTFMGVTPKYKWTLNGQPVNGDSLFAISNPPVGTHQLKAIVEADTTKVTDRRTKNYLKKFPIPATERTATLTVKQPVIELVGVTMEPTTLNFNGSSRITSVIRYDGPAAGEEIELVNTTTGGRLAPAGGNGTVSDGGKTVVTKMKLKPGNNSSAVILTTEGLSLPPGGPSQTVTVTAKAKDQTKSASATVTAPPAPAPAPAPAPPAPQPMQLDDVVFAKGSARTNNCGKRILDQVFERAASMGNYDVLLVGHFDAVEKNIKVRDAKAKKTRKLDEERVLQVAAVLSAGTEPCKRLDRSRIKVAMVGAEQLSAFKTSLCEATVKERSSGKISVKDGNAKNRRVEIWLVPKAGPMPNGIAGIQDAPASDIQSKGCPK